MQINLLTSKTVIGAIILALGKIMEVPELAGYSDIIAAVSTILQGLGLLIGAIGVRHAIAKASQGVAQLHPATVLLAILLLGCTGYRAPPSVGQRDTLYVVDTLLAVDSFHVTDTLRDTLETRTVHPVTVVLAPAPLGDSIYKVREIRVKPDSAKVKPGEQVQWCPWIVFKAGQWALPHAYDIPVCRASYTGTDRWIHPDAMQQFVADRTCVEWEVGGGAIIAQQC